MYSFKQLIAGYVLCFRTHDETNSLIVASRFSLSAIENSPTFCPFFRNWKVWHLTSHSESNIWSQKNMYLYSNIILYKLKKDEVSLGQRAAHKGVELKSESHWPTAPGPDERNSKLKGFGVRLITSQVVSSQLLILLFITKDC